MSKTSILSSTRTAKALPASSTSSGLFVSDPSRSIEWLGGVNYENLERTLEKLKSLLADDPASGVTLLVNSYGGQTGVGMAFYDAVHSVLRPRLTTIGSGDVDSSGVIIFLAGAKRYLTKTTTMLLHLAGRTFESGKRFSTADMETMLREDTLKDFQYASVVAEATNGKCSTDKVLELMRKDTLLLPEEAVNLGLADAVLA